ncbi:MAG: hypothetical protein JNK82_28400 [Myxococcaceae bacterium]|nr:hypothetical protein [Myxococcaceae bacterium]
MGSLLACAALLLSGGALSAPPEPSFALSRVELSPLPVTLGASETFKKFYLTVGVGTGFGHTQYSNGRHGTGLAFGFHARIGYRITEKFAVAGVVWVDPLYAVMGASSSASNRPFFALFAPGLWGGPSASFFIDTFVLTAGILVGGNFTAGTGPPAYGVGGFGTLVFAQGELMLVNVPFGRMGPFARFGLAGLIDPAVSGAFVSYVSLNAGWCLEFQ